MQEIILNVAFRDNKDKVESLRSSGLVPAVVYGKGQESKSIVVNSKDLEKAFEKAGESGVVVLKTPNENLNTLIHDYSLDPIKNTIIHADFLIIDMKKEVIVNLPIEFINESPAEKQGLGILTKVMHELEIKGLPKDLPHNITVDISNLFNLGDQIHAKDIKMPSNITLITNANDVVVAVTAIKEEKEEVVPVDLSSIEISEERGKKEVEKSES